MNWKIILKWFIWNSLTLYNKALQKILLNSANKTYNFTFKNFSVEVLTLFSVSANIM